MVFRFLHAADIHLGYQQYGLDERYDDFARAMERMVEDAIARRVDAVLLAGDLFHKRVIQPRTLLQATYLLGRLRDAGIRVLAIQGNHDRAYRQESFSWLDYLAEAEYWTLLAPWYEQGELVLGAEAGAEARAEQALGAPGGYIDLGDVRVIGLPYYGSATPRVVSDLARALERLETPRTRYTILMMHAGLQGVLDGYSATLTRSHLDALRPHVDYVALGHIHKPFEQDDWLYNPGSLETNSMTEMQWPDRGYYYVEVHPGDPPGHRAERIPGRRRPFISLPVEVDAYETPKALMAGLEEMCASASTSRRSNETSLKRRNVAGPSGGGDKPVVELRLMGTLAFGRAELDLARMQELVTDAYDALVCNVRDLTVSSDFEIRTEQDLDRDALERLVLRELVDREAQRRPHGETWTDAIRRLKTLALSGGAPAEVIAELRALREHLADDDEEGVAC
jgi:DNA repair protein SbcD/Mre11